ncbi:sulfoxide reductase catalytic subunit YedY [Sinobacterium caligoides]|uniref:Protein-methionine-sulfoxide reductase catalytic subunit MsrP n=1 Tax=Sinobacterium caligoides TaxID=933926 RepID=A0A3N2DFQ9_9GAMM|nr:protein-methionine-sulfoxide reductase catalytic subunit MsrP [Sinobacterium caligoides]ROR98617.1 sulfoxide reductase catalytic subunit YedY [Sinobacterium caligoides]
MLIKQRALMTEADTTNEADYLSRRQFVTGAAAGAALLALPEGRAETPRLTGYRRASSSMAKQGFFTEEALTPFTDVTSYNNFYEFGTAKTDPAKYSRNFVTEPWSVVVDGHCDKPGRYHLEDIVRDQQLEERIYRLRCVEAWSMVIPWVGLPLATLLQRMAPTSKAKYVAFTSVYAPEQMPGQRSASSFVEWPYVEGLRLDEAMHPLTIMAVGLYGRRALPQNGAPLRLVVPWKYGFKSAKSIVKISFTEHQPATTWNQLSAKEYGFFANVNPTVSHPRWSQSTERRLPSTLFSPNRIKTEMFNGYGEQVAGLYKGMDLDAYY